MPVTLPTFADLGLVNPRPNGQLPRYPTEDPGAAAQAALGGALGKAGGALVDIAADQDMAKTKLEESNATLDLVNRLVPLHTQISTETDPAKIAELRKEYDTLPTISGNAIGDPARRQAWAAKHANTILNAHADADKRLTLLDRAQAKADGLTRLDLLVRNGAMSDDPNAVAGTLAAVEDNLEWQQRYGSISPLERRTVGKQAKKQLIEGRARYLINAGRREEAVALLDQNYEDIDPTVHEALRAKAQEGHDKDVGLSVVNQAMGRAPLGFIEGRRRPGELSVGGAIPRRIAQAATQNNIDPTTALATAQIESSMGRNLGSRGNIFQLGRTEWASVGGGPMGEPDTDIKNGVAFLGKKREELASALGRDPQPWEIYLAHQQGTGGALALLSNPDKPAGQVVSARHISANGGDPNAPAAAFINKWRNNFENTRARITGMTAGVAGSGVEPQPVAIGDSIAAHLIRKAGVGGAEYNFDRNDDSTAVSGYGPAQVLDVINKTPEANIRGRDIILSTGVSNNPGQIDRVSEQIAALRDRGAASVTVLGVGTSPKVKAANEKLGQIATESGAGFAGPMRKVARDGIHSSDPQDLLAQAKAAMPGRGRGVDEVVAPPLAAEIDAAPASGEPIPLDAEQPSPPAPLPAPSAAPSQPAALTLAPDYMRARAHIMNRTDITLKQRTLALSALQTEFSQEIALNRSLDAAAKEDLANRQRSVFAPLMADAIAGKTLDRDMLAGLVGTQQISADQYNAVRAEMTRQGRGEDDPILFADLNARARAGEDVSKELDEAVVSGRLKGATALSVQRAADARRQKHTDEIEKTQFQLLKDYAGGDAVEKGMIDFGNASQLRQAQLWAQAHDEWNRRVVIGREDPVAVNADMRPRYEHPITDIRALPRPRVGPIEKIEDVAAVAQKTQAARDAGQLTEEQFNEDKALILRFKRILEEQEKRKEAAQTVPQKPGSDAARGRIKQ